MVEGVRRRKGDTDARESVRDGVVGVARVVLAAGMS